MDLVLNHNSEVYNMFVEFEKTLTEEHDQKDKVKLVVNKIEQKAQEVKVFLQQMHQLKEETYIKLADQATLVLETFKADIEELRASLEGIKQPFTMVGLWHMAMCKVTHVACVVFYLKHSKLISIQEIKQLLGISEAGRNLFVNVEEYLLGVLSLCGELSRFAINCVTLEDYTKPGAILTFMVEVESGFSILNLKNDMLRKRFDGLKYDVKKVEQVA